MHVHLYIPKVLLSVLYIFAQHMKTLIVRSLYGQRVHWEDTVLRNSGFYSVGQQLSRVLQLQQPLAVWLKILPFPLFLKKASSYMYRFGFFIKEGKNSFPLAEKSATG